MIDDQQSHTAGGFKVELVVAVALGPIVMSMTAYFALRCPLLTGVQRLIRVRCQRRCAQQVPS
jgi:hypothetical protein